VLGFILMLAIATIVTYLDSPLSFVSLNLKLILISLLLVGISCLFLGASYCALGMRSTYWWFCITFSSVYALVFMILFFIFVLNKPPIDECGFYEDDFYRSLIFFATGFVAYLITLFLLIKVKPVA